MQKTLTLLSISIIFIFTFVACSSPPPEETDVAINITFDDNEVTETGPVTIEVGTLGVFTASLATGNTVRTANFSWNLTQGATGTTEVPATTATVVLSGINQSVASVTIINAQAITGQLRLTVSATGATTRYVLINAIETKPEVNVAYMLVGNAGNQLDDCWYACDSDDIECQNACLLDILIPVTEDLEVGVGETIMFYATLSGGYIGATDKFTWTLTEGGTLLPANVGSIETEESDRANDEIAIAWFEEVPTGEVILTVSAPDAVAKEIAINVIEAESRKAEVNVGYMLARDFEYVALCWDECDDEFDIDCQNVCLLEILTPVTEAIEIEEEESILFHATLSGGCIGETDKFTWTLTEGGTLLPANVGSIDTEEFDRANDEIAIAWFEEVPTGEVILTVSAPDAVAKEIAINVIEAESRKVVESEIISSTFLCEDALEMPKFEYLKLEAELEQPEAGVLEVKPTIESASETDADVSS